MSEAENLITLTGIYRRFLTGRRERTVLRDLDCRVPAGATLGIRGSSGSGKTTLARILAGLDSAYEGRRELAPELGARQVQMVFQDSLQSFNPRLKIRTSLKEAFVAGEGESWFGTDPGRLDGALHDALTEVGLDTHLLNRTPGRLSGGQRQRAAIARALLMKPVLLILDEPVAALDLSIQAKILNVLHRVREDYRMSMVIISHDPNVLHHMCEMVYTLEEGKLWFD